MFEKNHDERELVAALMLVAGIALAAIIYWRESVELAGLWAFALVFVLAGAGWYMFRVTHHRGWLVPAFVPLAGALLVFFLNLITQLRAA